MKVIKEYMAKHDKINLTLLEELKTTRAYIHERLEERDRTLMLYLRETQEMKAMLASSKEKDGGTYSKKNKVITVMTTNYDCYDQYNCYD